MRIIKYAHLLLNHCNTKQTITRKIITSNIKRSNHEGKGTDTTEPRRTALMRHSPKVSAQNTDNVQTFKSLYQQFN